MTDALSRLREAASVYAMHRGEMARQHAADLEWAINEIVFLRRQFEKAADRIAAQSDLLARRAEKVA